MTIPIFSSTFFSELSIDTKFHFLGCNASCVKVSSSQYRIRDKEVIHCSPRTLVQPIYLMEDIFDETL